jgi:serine/threonine-protein kinase
VYLAVDRRLDREVALKVMHPHLADGASGADFVARFRREARTAARLTHPGLVSVFDQGVDGDTSYLTMEYVDGTTLRRRLGELGALPLGEALRVTESVLDALTAAHRTGLVHRDIKPENVLLDGDDRVKLADFGLARAVTEVTSTTTGTVLGTVAYLAPELVTRGVADARTDVYATGILLFEILTGRQPFTGETPIQVAFQHVNLDIPAPSELVEWLPSEVDELVEALAARDPADRPLDAGAALALLRRTRSALDEATLARRADVAPTITLPDATAERPDDDLFDQLAPEDGDDELDRDHRLTTLLSNERGSTVALPIGTGLPEPPPPPSHRRRRIVAAVLAVLVLAGAGVGVWWYQAIGPGAYTTAPKITGISEERARDILAAQGLLGDRTEVFDDAAPAGEVVSSDPAAGERIENGGTVHYAVSKGPDLVAVPGGVVGVMQDVAAAALTAAEFEVAYGPEQYHDEAAVGLVLSATLPDGTAAEPEAMVKRGTTITLVLSKGPGPATVTSVVGATVEAATAQLAQDALKLAVGEEQFHDSVAAGLIISQSPEAPAVVKRGDTVTVAVSKGPEFVEMPPLIGQEFEAAKATLEALGLTVKREEFWLNSSGRVLQQSVKAGDPVKVGSQVVLTVA